MERFLADADGFSHFYRSHARDLLVFFTRRTFDAQASLDLTAETFAAAFSSRGSFRGSTDAEAGAWLATIARRRLARYYEQGTIARELGRKLSIEAPVASDGELAQIERVAELDALRGTLRERLMSLDEGQREALWLRVVEEQPYAEVAQRLEISEPAARMRVSRALRTIAESLSAAPPETLESRQ
jgi:RNA polymerase sigma-70 factor (ECF subfamily)